MMSRITPQPSLPVPEIAFGQGTADKILDANARFERLLERGRCLLGGRGQVVPLRSRTRKVAILHLIFHTCGNGLNAVSFDVADRPNLHQRLCARHQAIRPALVRILLIDGIDDRGGNIRHLADEFGAGGYAGFGKVAEIGDGRIVGRNAGEGVEFGHKGTAAVDCRLECSCGNGLGDGDILTRLVQRFFSASSRRVAISAPFDALAGRLATREARSWST